MVSESPQFVRLQWQGLSSTAFTAGAGPVVLCLHGFPDHAASFRHQLPALAQAGFRAIAPNLRGYEPTAQPGRAVHHYHPVRVAADVVEWAKQLGPQPIHVVGHDWGAVAAGVAAATAPECFRSVTMIAVPPLQAVEDGVRRYPSQLRNSWYMFFFQLRGLADWVVRRNDFAFIERLWRDWSPGWHWDPADMAALKETFRRPGVLRAALAYYRASFNPFLGDSRRVRGLIRARVEVPTLVVTGATDGCMDTRIFDCIDASLFPAGLHLERIAGAGHFVHQEAPEHINGILIDWLRRA